jgi:hypothetical protein
MIQMDKLNVYDLFFLTILFEIIIIFFIIIFGLSNIYSEIFEILNLNNIQQFLITVVKQAITTVVKTVDNYI